MGSSPTLYHKRDTVGEDPTRWAEQGIVRYSRPETVHPSANGTISGLQRYTPALATARDNDMR